MIPKIIHYCWFGKGELPQSVEKCIISWKKYCPEYEIKRWDESNWDVGRFQYTQQAYDAKKYAFVSDVARLDIIYREGGVYLDTDVELIKPLDSLLVYSAFLGMESPGMLNTGLGYGAIKGNKIIKENLDWYRNLNFLDASGKFDLTTCVEITTFILEKYGLKNENSFQNLGEIVLLPTEFLCPLNVENRVLHITDNTLSIHHYDATWISDEGVFGKINLKLWPLKIKIKKYIEILFGNGSYRKIKRLIKNRK